MRHLIYHIYPSQNWDWVEKNLTLLSNYWSAFTGVKIAAIALDSTPIPDSVEIRKRITDICKFDRLITLPNNPILRETASFPFLIQELQANTTSFPQSNVFYAHTKGTQQCQERPEREEAVGLWIETMYKECLTGGGLMSLNQLSDQASSILFSGCFKTKYQWKNPELNKFGWHYSGTFFWFNPHKLYQQKANWRTELIQDRYGLEAWPGRMVPWEDAHCIHGENCGYLYDLKEIKRCA